MAESVDKDALKQFGEEILGKMAEIVKEIGAEKKKKEREAEDEKPPKVSSKGIQKNLDFNFKIRNILTKATANGELEEAVKEVQDLLKARNGELLLLDSDPSLLQTKDKLDALKAIAGVDSESSTTQSDMTSILLLSNLAGNNGNRSGGFHGESKRRRAEPYAQRQPWFRHESTFRGQGSARQYGGQGLEAEVEKEESSASSAPSMVTMPQNVNKEGMSFPDRLSAAIDFWKKICDVEWILSVIEDGFKIQLNSNVVLPKPQGLRPSVIRHKEFLVAEIERLEAEGVLTRSDHQPRCVSPLHVVEQGKKKRMILDLSELNESLVPPRFKLENLKTAWPFLEDAHYAATFDFKSGYHHIKIHEESQDLLSFTLTNPPTAPYFSFRGLPFGLSTAPWLFTKIFKVLVLKWRAEGIKIFLYLDDGLIVGKTEREVARAVRKVREDLNSAGVCVAEEKSFWVPDAKFTWLGYECDLVAREVRGTEKRMAKWQVALEELRRSAAPTVLDRMKFLGCLASFELVAGDVGVGRARSIMQTVGESQRKKSEPATVKKKKTPGEEREIEFWRERGTELLKRSIVEIEPEFDLFLYTDASARGIGAVLKNERDDVLWKMSELGDSDFEGQSSAWREVTAVKRAAEELVGKVNGNIQVLVDSQAAVSVLRRGSMKPELHKLAEKVWEDLSRVGESQFLWIPREQNVDADEASRNFDFDDWGVADRVFRQAQKLWGEIKVDWFADANNRKTEVYFSRYPEFGTSGVNVFDHIERAERMGCAWWVPPPMLIPHLLKIGRKRRLRGVLVAPLWRSHASYQALVDHSGRFIRAIKDYIIYQKNDNIFIPGEGSKHCEATNSKYCRSEFILAGKRILCFSLKSGEKGQGAKRQFVEELKQKAGEGFEHHIERLKRIPFEAKATSTAAAYKAENDKRTLEGRRSFFNYEPGSDAVILMCRWRLRTKGKCPYVFSHLDGSKKLSKQAISTLSTKMLAAIGKPGATHH
ncbi:Protein CBG11637 [Caenorhabditis briggsae]|uniref:Protein CBG11637 n=1 Tax=Caenorhabditis briggsae TaxID=6238 RepID=A8XDP3_CAEBR|nr:Protein CBG11637 [Caenorhabditis briggsae]CAP30763.2 Protein CBG11637 [Caenorhabditis briggsae]